MNVIIKAYLCNRHDVPLYINYKIARLYIILYLRYTLEQIYFSVVLMHNHACGCHMVVKEAAKQPTFKPVSFVTCFYIC